MAKQTARKCRQLDLAQTGLQYFARGHSFHYPQKLILFLKILEISQIS